VRAICNCSDVARSSSKPIARWAFTPLTGCSIAATGSPIDPLQNLDGQSQIELLDRLFPRVETGGPHGQKQTFADWLQETASQCLSRVDARDWPLHAAGVKGLVTCR